MRRPYLRKPGPKMRHRWRELAKLETQDKITMLYGLGYTRETIGREIGIPGYMLHGKIPGLTKELSQPYAKVIKRAEAFLPVEEHERVARRVATETFGEGARATIRHCVHIVTPYTIAEIAEREGCAFETVKHYHRTIYPALNVTNRQQAVVRLLDLEEVWEQEVPFRG